MKKTRLVAALLCVATLCVGVAALTACNDTPTPTPTDTLALTDGVFDGTYTGGGYKQDTYIRFHEEGEVLAGKKTFYYHAYSGEGATAQPQVKEMLGTYEVVEESITVKCWQAPDKRAEEDGGVCENRTADKTIVCKSLDGQTEYFKTGYDSANKRIFGIPATKEDLGITTDNNMGVMSFYCNYCYLQTTDAKTDRGVALESFYADVNEVKNASLVIYHNKTYADNKVTGEDNGTGTWTKSGTTYTLTTTASGLTGGSLEVAADGHTATFTPTGKAAISMKDTRNRTAEYTLTGDVDVDNGQGGTIPSTLTVTLNDDNSAVISIVTKQGSMEIMSQEGTWENVEGSILVSNTIFAGNLILSEVKEGDKYVLSGKIKLQGGDTDITVKTAPYEKEEEKATALYTFNGGYPSYGVTMELKLMSDNTAVLTSVNGTGAEPVTANGTWTANESKPATVTITGLDTFNITENNDGTFSVTINQMPLKTELPKVIQTMSATLYNGYLTYTLELYNDKTAVFTNKQTGSDPLVVKGAWTEEGGKPVSVNLGSGATAMTLTVTESNGIYTATNGLTGQSEVTVTTPLTCELTGGYPTAGVSMTLKIYANGVAALVSVNGTGATPQTVYGTWAEGESAFATVTFTGMTPFDVTENEGVYTATVNQMSLSSATAE